MSSDSCYNGSNSITGVEDSKNLNSAPVPNQPAYSYCFGDFAAKFPRECVIPGETGVLQQLPTDEGEQPRIGSSKGGCSTQSTTICIPCDLGLPGASCIPKSEWPPQEGVLEQPTQPLQPPTTGDNVLSQPGVIQRLPADGGAVEEPPPTTEGTQPTEPATVEDESLPPCPEGQVLDEESGLCVLEEPEAPEEEPEQSQPEGPEQPSEESDSGNDSNN